MLGKLFGKKSGQARAAVSKLANRDLMEAVVYGSIYVAAADGELEESELSKIETILSNNPALQGFGAELSNTIDRAKTDFKSGARILRQNAEKELVEVLPTLTPTVAPSRSTGNIEFPLTITHFALLN